MSKQHLRVIIGIILVTLLIGYSCVSAKMREAQKKMTSIKSADEIMDISGKAIGNKLTTGVAEALPIITKKPSKLVVVVLYYKEPAILGVERIYPPNYIVEIDPIGGQVVRNEACSPKMLGINKNPDVAEEGFGLEPTMTGDEYWRLHDRFIEMSSIVWSAFASGNSNFDNSTRAVLKEYSVIFKRIAKKPLLPYYHAVAPDFFKWLEQVTR